MFAAEQAQGDAMQAKLRQIDCELEPMRRQFNSIEYKAQTRSAMVAYAGLGLLCCQFALFLRLTYWELSWYVPMPAISVLVCTVLRVRVTM